MGSARPFGYSDRCVRPRDVWETLTDPGFALTDDGTLTDDFCLDEAENVTHVRRAPSPAATSGLALARQMVTAAERIFELR